jgi:hypothetical protein
VQGDGDAETQTPVPSQFPTPMAAFLSVEQLAAPQVSPWWVWQAEPFARHCALAPHAFSVHAVWQQVPDTQWRLLQSESATHVFPFAILLPHLFVVLRHVSLKQFVSLVQVVRHEALPLLHWKGAQSEVVEAGQ